MKLKMKLIKKLKNNLLIFIYLLFIIKFINVKFK